MSNLAPFAACTVPAASLVATPTVPAAKSFGGALTSHSGAGLYEFTLDDACNAAECLVDVIATGAITGVCQVEHVSDTVKRVRTTALTLPAGVRTATLVDTLAFAVKFTRMPAGH